MTEVVAAVIERAGQILICQRRPGHPHELKWEFPGGKLEAGESAREALCRELREELGINAVVGREIASYEYTYAGKKPILLTFFGVTEFSGEPRNLVFAQIVWEERSALPGYDFLEGDVEFVKVLAGLERIELPN